MNKITNILVLLLLISFILPATAIKHASASTDNATSSSGESTENKDSSSGGSTDNNNNAATSSSESSDNKKDTTSSAGGSTENKTSSDDSTKDKDSSSGKSSDNNNAATSSGESTKNDSSTGNTQQQNNSSDNTTSSNVPTTSNNTGNADADLVNNILAVHNSERAAVGVQPLVWSDDLAASAKTWAEHLATTPEFAHDPNKGNVGENIAGFNPSLGISAPGEGQSLWVAEKKDYHGGVLTQDNWFPSGHYTQMVWKNTKEVGCATASGSGHQFSILVCRYSPPGNFIGQAPY